MRGTLIVCSHWIRAAMFGRIACTLMKIKSNAARAARSRRITRNAVCQVLEDRRLFTAFAAHITMEPAGVSVPAGYVADVGLPFADRGNGMSYGWDSTSSVDARVRTANPDARYDTFIHTQKNGANHSWQIAVPNGTYAVHMVAGDADFTDSNFKFNANGALLLSGKPSNANHWVEGTGTVTVTNGVIAITNAPGSQNNKIDFIDIVQQDPTVVTPPVVIPPVVIPPLTSTPFTGTPVTAGQPIEAENYDLGGEGVAYHDSTKGNITKGYRTDDVDIQAGGSNGFNIGNTLAGEWLNYTITVPTTGAYTFSALASAPANGAKFHVEFDGTNLAGSLAVPNSGGWTTFANVSSGSFNLTAGVHVMRVAFDSNLNGMGAVGNFDVFNVNPVATVPPVIPPVIPPVVPPVVISTPYGGTPALAGQPIQAENYDLGGEGIAYHDSTKGNITKGYRTDDVDIQAGGSNGFNIGNTLAGEWMNYTITVPTTGMYVFSARASGPTSGATFHAEFDGANLTGSLAVPNEGGWLTWGTVASNNFQLTAGTHVMRVVIDTNLKGWNAAGNFDVFNVTPILAGPTLTWTPAAPSPVLRYEGYTRAFAGKMYVFAGFSTISDHLTNSDSTVYDPATNTWTSLGQIPCPTTHAGVAFDDVNGIMYFVGGLDGPYPSVASTAVWAYNIPSNTWSQLPSLPVGSAAGAAVLLNGQLHYIGGIQSNHNIDVNVHYVLTLGDTTWQNAAAFPMARDHITAVALNGKIYSFGGEIGHDLLHQQQTEADVYDPTTDAWTQLADMPLSKSHVESDTFVSNGKIIIAGGQIDDHASTNTILEYDPSTNTWGMLGNLPGLLQGAFLQPVGNQLILTDGYDGTYLQAGTWIADWTSGA